jgi:hypothetical protein
MFKATSGVGQCGGRLWLHVNVCRGRLEASGFITTAFSFPSSRHIHFLLYYLYIFRSVFENSVLRRIFGPKKDEVTGDWRKLHNEELHNLYSSPSMISLIKSRKMR